jgi:hypothetical protein
MNSEFGRQSSLKFEIQRKHPRFFSQETATKSPIHGYQTLKAQLTKKTSGCYIGFSDGMQRPKLHP